MIQYLSDEWLAAADRSLAVASTPKPDTATDTTTDPASEASTETNPPVTVAVTVTGGPQGDRAYTLILGPQGLRISPSPDEGATVTMTMSYEVAAAIAQGDHSAQRAFLDGQIRLGGNTSALLGHEAVKGLAQLADCHAALRSSSVY